MKIKFKKKFFSWILIFVLVFVNLNLSVSAEDGVQSADIKLELKDGKDEIEVGGTFGLTASGNGVEDRFLYRFLKTAEDYSGSPLERNIIEEGILQGNITVLQEYSSQRECYAQAQEAGTYTLILEVKDDEETYFNKSLQLEVHDKRVPEEDKNIDSEGTDDSSTGEQTPEESPADGKENEKLPQAGSPDYGEEKGTASVRATSLGVNINSNVNGQINFNESVRLEVQGYGGAGNYEYRIIEVNGDNAERVLQDYSSNSVFTYTPAKTGDYSYYVYVRDSEMVRAYNVYRVKVVLDAGQSVFVDARAESTGFVGDDVTIKATAGGGYGEYEYRILEVLNGKETVLKDYDSSDTFAYKPKSAGTCVYYVYARDKAGQRGLDIVSITLKYKVPLSITASANMSNPVYFNNSIRLNGTASGGSGGYQYKFVEVAGNVEKVLQEYSNKSEYTVKPEALGTYVVRVYAKDSQGQEKYTERSFDMIVRPGYELSATASIVSQGWVGNDVTINVNANKGYGTYQYRILEVVNGKERVLKDYDSNSKFIYKPSDAGRYDYYIYVKDQAGQRVSVVKSVNISYKNKLSLSVRSNMSNPVYFDNELRLTAAASGGSGKLQYRFLSVYNGKETVLQDYEESSQLIFKPDQLGKYSIYVYVKDDQGQRAQYVYNVEMITRPGYEIKGSASVTSSGEAGTPVKINIKALNGYGGYNYRILEVLNGREKVLQDYSEADSFEYTPTESGDYSFYIYIRDRSGQRLQIVEKLSLKYLNNIEASVECNLKNPVYYDNTVRLRVNAYGGSGVLQYRFLVVHNGKEEVISDYTSKNECLYTPQEIGEYLFYIYIKDSAGQRIERKYNLSVIVRPEKQLKASISLEGGILGNDVELSVSASNGYGNYEYRILEVFGGKERVLQDYSSSAQYNYRPTKAGSYLYYVYVRDKTMQRVQLVKALNIVQFENNRGIDVSAYQGTIDWGKVKASGISFAMLRVVSGSNIETMSVDSKFYTNIANANKNGIPVGGYRYGYAVTEAEAQKEAEAVINAFKTSGYKPQYPIAYDVEGEKQSGLTKAQLTKVIKAFQRVIENNGYTFMIYASKDWLENKIDMTQFANVDVWIARWAPIEWGHGYSGPGNVTLWQYSEVGKVPGISGNVDVNIRFKAY